MDFLKSAVASAIAKGPPFPYSFGDKVDIDESIWTLYNGTKRVRTYTTGQTLSRLLTFMFRKTVQTAASSPSISQPTGHHYP